MSLEIGSFSFINSSITEFVVCCRTNAGEAIGLLAAMEAPYDGYYKLDDIILVNGYGGYDQLYCDVELNATTYTYATKGSIIGARVKKGAGVYDLQKIKILYKSNI